MLLPRLLLDVIARLLRVIEHRCVRVPVVSPQVLDAPALNVTGALRQGRSAGQFQVAVQHFIGDLYYSETLFTSAWSLSSRCWQEEVSLLKASFRQGLDLEMCCRWL